MNNKINFKHKEKQLVHKAGYGYGIYQTRHTI